MRSIRGRAQPLARSGAQGYVLGWLARTDLQRARVAISKIQVERRTAENATLLRA